jgi:hypothetical protein
VDLIADRLQPASRILLAAWRELPAHDCVPMRASFDPIAIASILPIVSLIERISADEWRLRLAGTELERRWGATLTGLTFAEVLSAQAAAVTHCELEAVCRQPCGSRALRHLELRSGRRLQTETLRLPLRGKSGAVDLILCCNGELPLGIVPEADQPREIITVVEQKFFDIGAGIPAVACMPAPVPA